MTISTYRDQFYDKLKGLYEPEEIQSFFSILSEYFLKLKRIDIALNPEMKIDDAQLSLLKDALERLQKNEPIQYIIGETEFYGLRFKVTKDTLIPRPETEELVSWILSDLDSSEVKKVSILDIGTGSGCIAVSLAKNLPNAEISAMDISEEALKIAKENAQINKTEVNFIQQDILSEENLNGNYTIIVSNPPYVRVQEKELMKPNVLEYEPEGALFVPNEDPLVFYKAIAEKAGKCLKTPGIIYFEINEYLSKELSDYFSKQGFRNVEIRNDIFEKPRLLRLWI